MYPNMEKNGSLDNRPSVAKEANKQDEMVKEAFDVHFNNQKRIHDESGRALTLDKYRDNIVRTSHVHDTP